LATAATAAEWLQGGWWSNVRDHRSAALLRSLDELRGRGSPAVEQARAELHDLVSRAAVFLP
jgi:hypothetical protein